MKELQLKSIQTEEGYPEKLRELGLFEQPKPFFVALLDHPLALEAVSCKNLNFWLYPCYFQKTQVSRLWWP
jgi:hypothetical protein